MMNYRKPIDYSLGDSLDEMLKRRTNFSKMMRPNDSAEPVILSRNGSSQLGSSQIFSHNNDKYLVPEDSVKHMQSKVNAPILLPHMDQYSNGITTTWNTSNKSRYPSGKQVTNDDPGKDLEMHSRHDESSKRKEYKSSRCSPERSRLNLPSSAMSTHGLFELLPEDLSLLMSDQEASLVVTSPLQECQFDTFMVTGAWDQNLVSSKSAMEKEKSGKCHVINYDRLGSSPTELYTYISSSSSSTDLNGLKSWNITTPNQFSFSGQTSNRKPPKPPRIKAEKNMLSSSLVVDTLKESESMKRSAQSLNSLLHSDSKTLCFETPTKTTSFNDDDITELSDLRFTYSPASSASCLTPNNLNQRFLELPSNDEHVQGNEELVNLYYQDKSTIGINPYVLEKQLIPKDQEVDTDSFNSSLVAVIDDEIRVSKDSISIGDIGYDATSQTTNCKIGGVYQNESFIAAVPILKNQELDQVSFPSSLTSNTSTRYSESISSISPRKIIHRNRNEKDSFSSMIHSENKINIELDSIDDDQSDIRTKLSVSNSKEDVDKQENVFIGLCNDIAFLMTHGIHENEQVVYDEKSILDLSTYSETFYQDNKDVKTNFHFCLQCGIDDIGENLDELNENISYINTMPSQEVFKVTHVVSGDQHHVFQETEIDSFSEDHGFAVANTLSDSEVCDELNHFNIEVQLTGKVVDMNELESVLIDFEPCKGSEVHSNIKQSHFGWEESKSLNESYESKTLPRMDLNVVERQDVLLHFDDDFHPLTRTNLVTDRLQGDIIQRDYIILPNDIDVSLSKGLENDDFERVRHSRGHYGENERFKNHEETLFRQSKKTIQKMKGLERRERGLLDNVHLQKESYLQDSNTSTLLFEKKTFDLDEAQIILTLQAINKRVNNAMPHCLVPMGAFSDHARTFRPNYLESRLPDIDCYFDTIDTSLKVYEQGLKDRLICELDSRIADVYIQPIFDLGESSNHHIDLPVDELPEVKVRCRSSKIINEVRIFKQILHDTLNLNEKDCKEFDAQRADMEKHPNVLRYSLPFHDYRYNVEDVNANSFDPECCISINFTNFKNEMEDTYLDLKNILDIPIEEDPIWKEIPIPKLEVLANHSPEDSTVELIPLNFEITSTGPTGLNDSDVVTPCKGCHSVTESLEIRAEDLHLYFSDLEIELLSNVSGVHEKQNFFFRKDEWHHSKRIISAALESAEAVTRAKCNALISWMEQKGKKTNEAIQSGNSFASKEMIAQIDSYAYKDLLQDDDTVTNENESFDLITLSSSSSGIE